MPYDALGVPRVLLALTERFSHTNGVVDARTGPSKGQATRVLAETMGVKPQSLRSLLRSMEERGLVQINPHLDVPAPRHTYIIALTTPGRRLGEQITRQAIDLSSTLDPQQRDRVRASLKQAGLVTTLRQEVYPREEVDVDALIAGSVSDPTSSPEHEVESRPVATSDAEPDTTTREGEAAVVGMGGKEISTQEALLALFLHLPECHRHRDDRKMITSLVESLSTCGVAVTHIQTAQAVEVLVSELLLVKNHRGMGGASIIADLQLSWGGLQLANRVALSFGFITHPIRPTSEIPDAPSNWKTCLDQAVIAPPPPIPVEKDRPGARLRPKRTSPSGTRRAAKPTRVKKPKTKAKAPKKHQPKRSAKPPATPPRRHHHSFAERDESELLWEKRLLNNLASGSGMMTDPGGIENEVTRVIRGSRAPIEQIGLDDVRWLLRHMATGGSIVRCARAGVTYGIALPRCKDELLAWFGTTDVLVTGSQRAAAKELYRTGDGIPRPRLTDLGPDQGDQSDLDIAV